MLVVFLKCVNIVSADYRGTVLSPQTQTVAYTGTRMQPVVHPPPQTGYPTQPAGYPPPSGYQPPTSGYQPHTSGYQQPTSGYPPPTSGYQLPTSGYQPLPQQQAASGYPHHNPSAPPPAYNEVVKQPEVGLIFYLKLKTNKTFTLIWCNITTCMC